MQRFIYTLALGAAVLLLGGCGGGASKTPSPGGNNNTGPRLSLQGPIRVDGSRESSVVPDQLNITSGLDESELRSALGKMGFSLLRRNGDHATVRVPGGMSLEAAAAELRKQYEIVSAEPINVISMPTSVYEDDSKLKSASKVPLDPMYGDQFLAFDFDGTTTSLATNWGQALAMDTMSFPGAWDTATNAAVAAVPVTVAVIDAGHWDYTVGRGDIDETLIDPLNSGSIDAAGTFTAGFAAATWTINDDGDPATRDFPFRDTGDQIFGLLAAQQDTRSIEAFDLDGNGTLEAAELWSEGIAGINPSAGYILIKTGSLSGGAWTFNDNEIAAAINHAVGAGANIIVLGMFGQAPVGANVQAAVNAARAADVLVIAPAGDVMTTFNVGAGTFAAAPVDITATAVTPASAVGVVSVAGAGSGRIMPLPQIDTGGGVFVDDIGQGWQPRLIEQLVLLDTRCEFVAPYSNFGATIAANAFGIGLGWQPFFAAGAGVVGDERRMTEGVQYELSLRRWDTAYSAAYVAGAASMVYQALAVSNGGAFPADVDTVAEGMLLQTADTQSMSRLDQTLTVQAGALANTGGYLNANKAMNQAISGGTLIQDPMGFTQFQINQPVNATTVGTAVQLTVNVVNGIAPFSISVDWGNGNGPQVTNPWVPGTIVTLPGGYGTLGAKSLNVRVTDSNGQTITAAGELRVINPLTASITVTNQDGQQVALNSLQLAENYIFELRASNLYTGTFDNDDNPATPEVPNVTTFEWDFDNSGGAADATGTAPVFAYSAPGTYTLVLRSNESFRPDQTFNVQVTVQ